MNHMLGWHFSSGGNNGLAGRQAIRKPLAANFFARRQDLRAAGAMDRSIDASAAHERAISRIDNGVDAFFGNVADLYDYSIVKKRASGVHFKSASSSCRI